MEMLTMQSVEEIYRDTVSRLRSEERLELAALILRDLTGAKPEGEKLSVLELINSLRAGQGFKTSADADEYLRGERESWDH
jgi:hypothetical protein